jgi:hypothetical protein
MRPVPYLQVFLPHVTALTTYQIFFAFAAQVTNRIPLPDYSYWRWQALPFGAKLVVFLFVIDGIAYWCIGSGIHRRTGRSIVGTLRPPNSLVGWHSGELSTNRPRECTVSIGVPTAQTGARSILPPLFLYVDPDQ